MKKKKRNIQAADEVVVFSDSAEEMPADEADKQQGEALISDETAENAPYFDTADEETDEYEEPYEEQPKKSFSFGFVKKLKKKKDSSDSSDESFDLADEEGYEQSHGDIIDVDSNADSFYDEDETELYDDSQVQEEETAFKQDMPVQYAKTSDDLPKAEKSDDVYADIVKNIDESVHEERTSRRAKYEREQLFLDAENPFQRDRDRQQQGEDHLSYEEVNRKELKTFDEIFDSIKARILPRKEEKTSEKIRKIVANTAVLVLICCAVAFGVIYRQGQKAEKSQLGLSSQIVDATSSEEEEKLWEEFRAKYPNIKTPEGMMAKYAYLYAINQQLVGWVSVPNSGIDVQIVQSQDNSEYLKKDFYGNYSRYGCPFLDYRNDARYLNQNTIIYGHHMSDGLIFAELSKYKELDGFLESPVIRFDTLYKTQYFKVYAAFITNSRETDDNGYIFNYTVTSFASTQNFDDYIKAVDERKLYTTGVDINAGDKLITLSTCTYEFNDARLVVIGRMLRTGETVDIDTTYATKNGNPHYPQAWYDKNGKTNPFAGAERWYPEGAEPVTSAVVPTVTQTATQPVTQ